MSLQLHPTSVPDLFHLIEVDGDEVNVTTARYLTPVAAKAHRVLERINVLHGIAAVQEAVGAGFWDASRCQFGNRVLLPRHLANRGAFHDGDRLIVAVDVAWQRGAGLEPPIATANAARTKAAGEEVAELRLRR